MGTVVSEQLLHVLYGDGSVVLRIAPVKNSSRVKEGDIIAPARVVVSSITNPSLDWTMVADKIRYVLESDDSVVLHIVPVNNSSRVKEDFIEPWFCKDIKDREHNVQKQVKEDGESTNDVMKQVKKSGVGKNSIHIKCQTAQKYRTPKKEIPINPSETLSEERGDASKSTLQKWDPHKCNVYGCGIRRYSKVSSDDEHGVTGPRCRRHGAVFVKCNVTGCGKQNQGRALSDDDHGAAGPRCRRHGAVVTYTKCNVNGCGNHRKGDVLNDDDHGIAGPRCVRHGVK